MNSTASSAARILQFPNQLESTSCVVCGIEFAAPRTWLQARRETGGSIHCPNGHSLSFGESEVDRLKKAVEAEQQRTTRERQSHEWTKKSLDTASRSAAALKGKITEIKNRVGNGVCPCCHRTFEKLARHMTSKHPGYKSEGAEPDATPKS